MALYGSKPEFVRELQKSRFCAKVHQFDITKSYMVSAIVSSKAGSAMSSCFTVDIAFVDFLGWVIQIYID